jgi:hypothetical protein
MDKLATWQIKDIFLFDYIIVSLSLIHLCRFLVINNDWYIFVFCTCHTIAMYVSCDIYYTCIFICNVIIFYCYKLSNRIGAIYFTKRLKYIHTRHQKGFPTGIINCCLMPKEQFFSFIVNISH